MPGGWSWVLDDDVETPAQTLAKDNARRQIERALAMVDEALRTGACVVDDQMLCELHGLAMAGLISNPGVLRTADVEIYGSWHDPPAWNEVRGWLDEMYAYINARSGDAVHAAAYTIWRTNWIHPFAPDGNGRVARAVGLVVLFFRLGRRPPATGRPTLLHRLAMRRNDYWDALGDADRAYKNGAVDVSRLETLLERLLTAELDENG